MPIPARHLLCPICGGVADVTGTLDDHDERGICRTYFLRCMCGWVNEYKEHVYAHGLLGG